MTENEKPKRGRPRKFGPRRVFNFRISDSVRERIAAAAAANGRSISEEIEARLNQALAWDADRRDIDRMRTEAATLVDAAAVSAIRMAGLQILREVSGRPTRVIVDLQTLLAEADGIARGFRSGFFGPGESPPPVEPTRSMTIEEGERLMAEIEAVKRKLADAVRRTRATDAAAKATPDDDAA